MDNKKHIVIFSHGFGTKKDDRGLLSGEYGIAESLNDNGVKTILFDYNNIDEKLNTITVLPLRDQVRHLDNIINDTIKKYPDHTIDIIAHSQGCLVPAKLKPNNIRKTILLAPSLNVDNKRMINLFINDPKTVINLDGISKLGRKDGTLTIVPKEYWIDRAETHPIDLYNDFSKSTELILIKAEGDDILGQISTDDLLEDIKVISLKGDHSFNDSGDRNNLIELIRQLII